MITIPNPKSILQKIFEYRNKYIKDHGYAPNVIYLDPEEREDLRKAVGQPVLHYPVRIAGMLMKHTEDLDARNQT